jgi:hypothetical protein
MRIKPIDSKLVVVLLGNFNPLIFQPHWFATNGVLGEEEAKNADIEVIHTEVVKFSLSWLTVLVEKNRFIAEVTQPPDVRLYDLILRTFGELLTHTPIWAMGINKRVEFDAGTVEQRDVIGITLAPPSAWGEWTDYLEKRNERGRGGMMSLSMRQTVTDDRPSGYIQTRVEPSKTLDSAVFVEVNDHHTVKDIENIEGCSEIMNLLRDQFENSIHRSEWIIDQVMGIIK